MIIIESKRKKLATILNKYPEATVVDVTSKANTTLRRLSPFYPHGGIPVPNSGNMTATCVEAVWQGLKVFEHEDIDISMFANATMKGLKRTSRKHGKVLGHRYGTNGCELLNYTDARRRIYIPTYRWMLDYKVQDIIKHLRIANESQTIVLLDYNTNCDIYNYKKPLSHAFLVKAYVEGLPPYEDAFEIIEHHDYHTNGRRGWNVVSKERRVKAIEEYEPPTQLDIPFDFKDD